MRYFKNCNIDAAASTDCAGDEFTTPSFPAGQAAPACQERACASLGRVPGEAGEEREHGEEGTYPFLLTICACNRACPMQFTMPDALVISRGLATSLVSPPHTTETLSTSPTQLFKGRGQGRGLSKAMGWRGT